MRVVILSNYYYPEQVGAGIWVRQLALDLKAMGHQVTVLTTFPNYPSGHVFPAYRGRVFQRDVIEGISVVRVWSFATPSKRFWPRVAAFGSFCATSVLGGLASLLRADVVYAVLPPLPLGVSAWMLAKAAGARLVVNVQDIYPDIAVALGVLRNGPAIRFFERMERWIYARANRIVVISEGFRGNLLAKGVAEEKVVVVPNWADPGSFAAAAVSNPFRERHGGTGRFAVLYSGGLSLNSNLEPVLDAAAALDGDRFVFWIAGEGAHKKALEDRAAAMGLRNVRFIPFQPIERYGEMLAAADATLVTLHSGATFASVPSKIFKQMAAARPVVAIADRRSEVARLVEESGCGVCVPPDDAAALVSALRALVARGSDVTRMGTRGREYVLETHSRSRCVAQLERVLATVL